MSGSGAPDHFWLQTALLQENEVVNIPEPLAKGERMLLHVAGNFLNSIYGNSFLLSHIFPGSELFILEIKFIRSRKAIWKQFSNFKVRI